MSDMIDNVLKERGDKYGPFTSHAAITQGLKHTVRMHLAVRDVRLTPSQQEALDMMFHKIGRIVNGDPDHIDSWLDIAGYATLIVNILKREQSK